MSIDPIFRASLNGSLLNRREMLSRMAAGFGMAALGGLAGQQPDGELYKKSKGSGYMPSPVKFAKHGQSGIDVSESLPKLASVIDDCCVIRSMRTDVPNHEPALIQMHTGNVQP